MAQVFLVGGGWSEESEQAMYGGFVEAARDRAGGPPRILLVVMGTDEESVGLQERYVRTMGRVGGHTLEVERVPIGGAFDPSRLTGVDALFVGGGPTPEYHASLEPAYAAIRDAVAGGMPYLGFSAGAEIAATEAIIGGWQVHGVGVCPEDSGEDLDELTVVHGIGLVEGAVEVHTAQWGNLSRLVAAVDAGLAPHGVALDECTTLEVATGAVTGAGTTWRVTPGETGVQVTRG
jgi:cyanophycinase